jgi:hypothetical protein
MLIQFSDVFQYFFRNTSHFVGRRAVHHDATECERPIYTYKVGGDTFGLWRRPAQRQGCLSMSSGIKACMHALKYCVSTRLFQALELAVEK